MSLELLHTRGRAPGACDGRSGHPRFTGTISEEGRVRIDCENYPEHWQEFQLPEEWVLAYHATQQGCRRTVVSRDVAGQGSGAR